MVRDTEKSASLYDMTRRTQDDHGIPLVVIIDEEHMFGGRNARKSEKVLATIRPKVEIRISATPNPRDCQMVEVFRDKVIEEEMIKESIVLNPALDFRKTHGSLNQHLIWLALQKRRELAEAYRQLGVNINPLLLIQLPNDSSEKMTADDTSVRDEVVDVLDAYGVNVLNGKLAIWLSGYKTDNLEWIDRPDDGTEVLLFKQAIALGWDCPRAAVLLIFRKLESFQFSAQTVGRILRMPEQKYYADQRLNQGYVYTNLSKDIIEIVKDDMNYMSTNAVSMRREGLDNVVLESEYSERQSADRNRIGSDFRELLTDTFIKKWELRAGIENSLFTPEMLFDDGDMSEDEAGYDGCDVAAQNRQTAASKKSIRWHVPYISVDVVKDLEMTGEVGQRLVDSKASYINTVDDLTAMYLVFCKRLLGNAYEQCSVKTLAGVLKEVMYELFGTDEIDTMKIVMSNDRRTHNRPKFERLISSAVEEYTLRLQQRRILAKERGYKKYDWSIPAERAYPGESYAEVPGVKRHALLPYMRCVRTGDAYDVEPAFEEFLEESGDAIDWWYKNGDQGMAHFSIGYINSYGKKSLFYVDYIIRMKNGDIYLFDTKTENSDAQAPYKHNALVDYISSAENAGRRMRGGVIVPDRFGNWIYPPGKIDVNKGTGDTSGWVEFIIPD